MANKIKLGQRPATFKEFDVKVTLPDGDEGVIPVTYKYRTKTEFGKWMDEAVTASGKLSSASDAFSWEEFYQQHTSAAVDQLLNAIDSWGLDEKLSRDSLIQMGDEIPAAVAALLSCYGQACREGRLGN